MVAAFRACQQYDLGITSFQVAKADAMTTNGYSCERRLSPQQLVLVYLISYQVFVCNARTPHLVSIIFD